MNLFQRFRDLVHLSGMIRDVTFCLASFNAVCICCEEKTAFYFSNYKGPDECMYRTCMVQHLQKGKSHWLSLRPSYFVDEF